MRRIKEMKFEVCGTCQNDCHFCAHAGMLTAYHGYQLSMDELRRFIDCTKQSGYFIERISMHGIGEPLLWKHFAEGIRTLKDSGVVGSIIVTTNGLLLDRLQDDVMAAIDSFVISAYPTLKDRSVVDRLARQYPGKFTVVEQTSFRAMLQKGYRNRIPCTCTCPGPMFIKDKLFLYCGPPVFDAARLKGVQVLQLSDLYVEMRPNYLDGSDDTRIGNMDLCNYCFNNANIHVLSYPWESRPSRRALMLESWLADTLYRIIPKSLGLKLNATMGSVRRFAKGRTDKR